jgi:hypothetical protein
MESIIFIILFNLIILILAFKTKIGLYTITPEEQWEDALNAFDGNYMAIQNIDNQSGFKLGTGHMYE